MFTRTAQLILVASKFIHNINFTWAFLSTGLPQLTEHLRPAQKRQTFNKFFPTSKVWSFSPHESSPTQLSTQIDMSSLIQKQQLEAAILRRASKAPLEFPSPETFSDVLQRAAQRRRERAAGHLPELGSLEVPKPQEYTWEDLVAGTKLPEPYYNPEDPVIRLDESRLTPAEAFEVDIETMFREPGQARIPEPPRQSLGSKKKGKQGQWLFWFTSLLQMMNLFPKHS
jgi:hypothetical protein